MCAFMVSLQNQLPSEKPAETDRSIPVCFANHSIGGAADIGISSAISVVPAHPLHRAPYRANYIYGVSAVVPLSSRILR